MAAPRKWVCAILIYSFKHTNIHVERIYLQQSTTTTITAPPKQQHINPNIIIQLNFVVIILVLWQPYGTNGVTTNALELLEKNKKIKSDLHTMFTSLQVENGKWKMDYGLMSQLRQQYVIKYENQRLFNDNFEIYHLQQFHSPRQFSQNELCVCVLRQLLVAC